MIFSPVSNLFIAHVLWILQAEELGVKSWSRVEEGKTGSLVFPGVVNCALIDQRNEMFNQRFTDHKATEWQKENCGLYTAVETHAKPHRVTMDDYPFFASVMDLHRYIRNATRELCRNSGGQVSTISALVSACKCQ